MIKPRRAAGQHRLTRTLHALIMVAVGWLFVCLPLAVPAGASQPRVLATKVDAEITPVIADHLRDGLDQARDGGYAGFVVELDTPGGLGTSMTKIVQAILDSPVPVIVYVSPEGGRAASAGAVITLASHVAVMAPGTRIGAATPVGLEGEDLSQKVVNDAAAQAQSLARLRDRNAEVAGAMVKEGLSLTAEQAYERDVIDGRAVTLRQALAIADGSSVRVAPGTTVTVKAAGAAIERYDMGLARTILQVLANPNLAYLLMTLATLGLVYELAAPGVGIAGGVGAASLILALFSLSVLPVNAAGVLLLLLAAALFVGELLAPGFAGFAVGGAAALVLAALFLFDETQGVRVDLIVAVPAAIVMAIMAIIAGRYVVRAQRERPTSSGVDALIGQVVTVAEEASSDGADARFGRALVAGGWWTLRASDRNLAAGEEVRVTSVDDLTLVVEHLSNAASGLPRKET